MRLFISYSSKDGKKYAKILYEILKSHGHDPFMADHCILGENLWDTISKECIDRDRTIFLMTSSSTESKGQKQEYDLVISFYKNRFAFISEKCDLNTIFQRYPLLKACLAPFFSDSNFGSQCKKLATQLVELQDKEKAVGAKQYSDNILPELSRKGLDEVEIEKCMKNLYESFQNETIIPEICRTRSYTQRPQLDFTTIGFRYRLPIQWFIPERPSICNDNLFQQFGRDIALGERDYLHQSILKTREITNVGEFSPKGVLEATERVQGNGFEPDLIFPRLDGWMSMHHWHNGARVEYDPDPSSRQLNASLILDKHKLKIVSPLGKVPQYTIVFSKHAITWHVRVCPEFGALFIALGRDQLYPTRYVELVAGTQVKCEIDPKGISTLG